MPDKPTYMKHMPHFLAPVAPITIDHAKGSWVYDTDGGKWLDFVMGIAVVNTGHCHPKVVKAVQEQATQVSHAQMNIYRHQPILELSEKLVEILPEGMDQVMYANSGAEAVENAVKLAKQVTRRPGIIAFHGAFHGAYHGVWMGTAALTTAYNYRHGWGPMMPGVQHLPYAYCYRCPFGKEYPSCDMQCGKFVDEVLNGPYTGADDVAAVVVESQQGEGGYVAPPPEFLEMIKAACEKNGCLYVADEVQSGAGRTGKMWAIQYSKVQPDMLTWGKGMGGDMPMAGVSYRAEMEKALREGSQPSTFAGNAMGCEVAMTNIDLITDPETDLLGRAAALGEEIKGLFIDAMPNVPIIGDVRGNGLMVGIEVVADRKTKEPLAGEKIGEITFKLLNAGILMTPCGRHANVFRFMPPLTIPHDYAVKASEIMIDILKGY